MSPARHAPPIPDPLPDERQRPEHKPRARHDPEDPSSYAEVAPLLGEWDPAHQHRAILEHDQPIARIDTDPRFLIVQARLDGERHSLLDHRVIAEGEERRLVPDEVLALPVSRTVIDVLLHPLLDLIRVDPVRDLRADRTGLRLLDDHLHRVRDHLPHTVVLLRRRKQDVVAIALTPVPAEEDVAVHVERLPTLDLRMEELVRVRIRRRYAGAHVIPRHIHADGTVRFPITPN